jgi:phosphoenolpyruvate-protein kinase (PTS system EI component)
MSDAYVGQTAAGGVALGRLRRVDRTPAPAEPVRTDRAAVGGTGGTGGTGRTGGMSGTGEDAVAGGMGLDGAFATVVAELAALADDLRRAGRDEAADIVDTNLLIAGDPELRAEIDAAVAGGGSSEAAVRTAVEHHAELLAALPDPVLASRAADVRSVGRRLLAALRAGDTIEAGASEQSTAGDGPQILAAYEISADDLLTAGDGVAGALSVLGGAGAHAAIVARGLGVPLVVGLDPAVLAMPDGTEVAIDGSTGTVIVSPDEHERATALAAAAAGRDRRASLAAHRGRPTLTRAGRRITVLANVGSVAEAEMARDAGAEGIGLLRTEMPFLAAVQWPSFAEHVAALAPILKQFGGLPVTVRTLDFGADKVPPFLDQANTRGLLPTHALVEQFRAIAEAADAHVKIMIPMVSSAAEVRTCRALLSKPNMPLGAMVETPEAVANASALAAEADFLSIGTNDLTAALLGLDRRDPSLTPARAAEPVVLDAIETVLAAAAETATPVSVCGDAAGDPAVIPHLVRLGCTTLSVAPAALDEVRALIATL